MNHERQPDGGPKTILLGLDGGDLEIFDLFIGLGLMPNLSDFMAEGCRGPLLSTIPPITSPAWTTMTTGLNPGKHGVFSFHRRLDRDLRRIPVNSSDVKQKRIWDYFSEQGKRVCVINVPLTYPPSPVNGLMVSGMLTPGGDADFTYPESLKAGLNDACGGYQIDTPWHHYRRGQELVAALRANLANRRRAIEHLMAGESFDFSMMVISSTDRLQHVFYRRIVEIGRRGTPGSPLDEEICGFYHDLDDFLGHLSRLYRESHQIFMVSDHGFRPVHTKVNINKWFAEHGYLRRRGTLDGGWLRFLIRRLDILGLERSIRNMLPGKRSGRTVAQAHIDWKNTRAYSGAAGDQAVYLNVAGRDPQGIVPPEDYRQERAAVEETLRSLFDPSRKEPIMEEIHRGEEIYRGPYTDTAPDLILQCRRGYVITDKRSETRLFNPAGKQTGWHSMEGMFAASGPGIRKGGRLKSLGLPDILPTLLYSRDLPLLETFDGAVREDVFRSSFQKGRQITRGEGSTDRPSEQAVVDEDLISQRLRSLGYL
jgi:predicted AlkP superfamily phosphohydrolase/phosphomutase